MFTQISIPSHYSRQPNPERIYNKQYQKHIPSGFCTTSSVLTIHSILNNQLLLEKVFNDDDFAQIFIDTLGKNIKEIYKKCKFPEGMIMTMHDKLVYDKSTLCHICYEELDKDKVRHHCHLCGKFRGAAHEV